MKHFVLEQINTHTLTRSMEAHREMVACREVAAQL